MKNLNLDELTTLGSSGPHNLIEVSDASEWDKAAKKPGERIGTYYTVLRASDMEKIRVLVRDSSPVVDPAIVQQRVPTLQFVKVVFDNLKGNLYADEKRNLHITAEATAVKLYTPQRQQGQQG